MLTIPTPDQVCVNYMKIPKDFIGMHKYVILVADILFVNDLPFLITSLQDICLVTVEYLTSRTISKLASTLTRAFKIYAKARLPITE